MQIEENKFPLIKTDSGFVKQAYGIEFPASTPDYRIELHCCFRYKLTKERGGLGPTEHFWNFLEIMYPDYCQRDNFFMDIFLRNIIEGDYRFYFCIGPGGFGKTTLAALIAIGMWIEDPKNNAVIACTSTLDTSEGRIWGKIKNLYSKHPEFLQFSKVTKRKIYFFQKRDNGTTDKDEFHCMKLSALPKGDSGADSVLRGMHPDRKLFLILDEMDQSAAIDEVVENLQKGDVDFTALGLGNPADRFSALGLVCEPFGGWDSINPLDFTDISQCAWDSIIEEGRVLFFPGYLNPRIYYTEKYPERAEYYNQRFAYYAPREIYDHKKKKLAYNKWCEQFLGFFPEQNSAGLQYLIDKKEIRIHNAHIPAVFIGYTETIKLASCDPGFTHGGDQTVLRFGNLGHIDSGKMGLDYGGNDNVRRIRIPKTMSMNKYKWIATELIQQLRAENIDPQHFCIDANSAGDAIIEFLYELWSRDFKCMHSKGLATERPLYYGNNTTARDECINRITEDWLVLRKLILTDQIRGLDNITIEQLASRAIIQKPNSPKIGLEPKADYKKRMTSIGRIGSSPDEGDTAVYMSSHARNFGLLVDYEDRTNNKNSEALKSWHNMNQTQVDEFYQGRQDATLAQQISEMHDNYSNNSAVDVVSLDNDDWL